MIASYTFGFGMVLTNKREVITEEKALTEIDTYKAQGYKTELTCFTVFVWKK